MPKVFDNVQFGFAACRIGMRKCWQWLSCYRPVIIIRDQYEVLCLGLKGAGKTTALATLVGESVSNIEPTTGFNIKTLPLKDTVVDIKELGGSDVIRPFWNKYFEGQHGILYVIDAAAEDESLKEAVKILHEVISASSLKGVPCVILATHQDVKGSKTQQELNTVMLQKFYCSSFHFWQIQQVHNLKLNLRKQISQFVDKNSWNMEYNKKNACERGSVA